MSQKIRIGASACLLGEAVRFDGGHKRSRFLLEEMDAFVDWFPVCPEVEMGLPTPRPSMRLVQIGEALRLDEPRSGADLTRDMERFASVRVAQLAGLDLDGYVLKKDSPSCGMERVRVRRENGQTKRDGRGLFARELMRRLPDLPVEEEGRLQDAKLREGFVERAFAYRRVKQLFDGDWTAADVVRFHSEHKLQLMAHSQRRYRELGRLAASAGLAGEGFAALYTRLFMAALAEPASVGRNVNVLQHMSGYLRSLLDADSRHEMQEVIEDYQSGLVPLAVPVTLLGHHVRDLGIDYLAMQSYLQPHPKQLRLRNYVCA